MRVILVLVGIAVCIQLQAQQKKARVVKGIPTICYLSTKNEFTSIAAPQRNGAARTKGANIQVTYDGFTTQAQQSFQAAVDIWESLLESNVTINIEAHWAPLGPGVLGSAGPASYIADFDGAPKQNVLYPVALAEKIAGENLNGSDPDIVATFNSTNNNWHYGLAGVDPPAGEYDLMSIVLHEIGHGLGITHGYSVDGGLGDIPDFFGNRATAYEVNIITLSGKNFVTDFTPPSSELKSVMTSALYFASPLVRSVNSNFNATLYTPETYSAGSSIAHLDEDTFRAGNINSLMTPFIGSAERILDPGPIVKNILKEMGWISTQIEHTPLPNTENTTGPFDVVARIRNTNGYSAGSVKVSYKTTGSFTDLVMTATGNANEFKATIPSGSSQYSYYISVVDSDNRTFTNPGTIITPGVAPQQGLFTFESGPDTKAPVITHTPKEFITTNESSAEVQATVTDNIGVDNVKVQWRLNDVDRTDAVMTLVDGSTSAYTASLDFGGNLQVDDKIEYRIRAEDSSVAHNVAFAPTPTTYYLVNVVGLGVTADAYSNDFNDLSSDDFFGNGFTVSKPSGFSNGAIHSDHPYAAGGAAGAHVDLIYNLKTPIRISGKASDAIMKFDEIVLVEPGEAGAAWPSDNFYDYVVVEGSTDGGITWVAVADGYDANLNSVWSGQWNATSSSGNSTATGIPSMYRTHTFNLLDKFSAGDEVAFRFRLFSDPFSYGWGWSIDNLKIQIDDTPPSILHQHADFITSDSTLLNLEVKVKDASGVEQIFFEYSINSGEVVTTEIPVIPGKDEYTQPINPSALELNGGDVFEYAFRAIDSVGNASSFPPTGFIKTAIISLSSPVDQITADFSSDSPDITGNFFSVSKTNLSDFAYATAHPYPQGMGPDSVSDFSWVTKTPIKVSGTNPMIYYKDIALVEYGDTGVKDYVVVEGSKDGVNWTQLIAPYAANSVTLWKSTFDVGANGSNALFTAHTIDITNGGVFKADDVIIIRFRLHSDSRKTGWGWAVDNLSIQSPITGVEPAYTVSGFDAWPNPITDGRLHLKMSLPAASQVSVEILTTQGKVVSNDRFSAPSGDFERDYQANWAEGFYIVRIQSDYGTAVKKIIKLNSQN